MSMRITLIPCLAAALILGACGEDKGAGPVDDGKTALLTGAQWKMSAHTITPGVDLNHDGNLVTDLSSTDIPCKLDDITNFTADGKWSVSEGATKCVSTDPQVETGTWVLKGESLKMVLDGDGFINAGKIASITASQWSFSMPLGWMDGSQHIETLTYSAQ